MSERQGRASGPKESSLEFFRSEHCLFAARFGPLLPLPCYLIIPHCPSVCTRAPCVRAPLLAALLGVELAASAPFLPALRDVALLHSTSYDEEGRGIASELSPLGVAALCAGALTAAPALSLHCAHRCRHSDEAPAVTAAWGSVLAALPPALRKRVQVAERHEGPALVEELVRSVSQSEGDGE